VKLTREQTRNHEAACAVLAQDTLSDDDREFVFTHWHEGATHLNGKAGAHFTPLALAYDMEFDFRGRRIIDLCAGIGVLSFVAAMRARHGYDEITPEIVCIEINPAYVEIGRKLVPEATWICGDALDPELLGSLGHFDCAFGNPPYGKSRSGHTAPRYGNGNHFEYQVIDAASDIADYGTFLIPQQRAPFTYSGRADNRHPDNPAYERFSDATGITMDAGIGVDTEFYKDEWKDVKPICEIVCCDFMDARDIRRPAQSDLFTTEAA